MRLITASYRKIVESAESLAERDTKAYHERLTQLESEMGDAVERMGAKEQDIQDQDRDIGGLKHTIHDIVRILGAFIQNNISSWVESIDDPRTQEVLKVISDYTRWGDNKSVRYFRIPEATLANYAKDIQEARALATEYRRVLSDQSTMISDQSEKLDTLTEKYGKTVGLVRERDHELLLLAQQNETLKKKLEESEAALGQSREANVDAEVLNHRYEESRGNMENLKMAHEMEIDQREAEIANLRQKLGSAREEVFARREDVKNILSHTQAVLQTPSTTEAMVKSSHASKALRFLGMERDKEKFKRGLPSSRSMMGFPSSSVDVSRPYDSKYSSKELAPAFGNPIVQHVSSLEKRFHARTSPNTPFDSPSGSTDSVAPALRPRSDSLRAMQRYGLQSSPIDTQKSLPAPPTQGHPQLVSAARLAEVTQSIHSPTTAQITTDYFKNSLLGQTAARRVLSNIPELCVSEPSTAGDYDKGTLENGHESDDSVASSDREVYRKSICALDMLNSSTIPYSETETDVERIVRRNDHHDGGDSQVLEYETRLARVLHLRPGSIDLRRHRVLDAGRDERARQSFMSDGSGYRTEDSEPMTVAQLYHQGGRHIRG